MDLRALKVNRLPLANDQQKIKGSEHELGM